MGIGKNVLRSLSFRQHICHKKKNNDRQFIYPNIYPNKISMNRYCCHEDNIEESLYEIFSNAGYFQIVHLAVQNSQK